METGLRKSPLYEIHVASGARMVDFAGWAMPVMVGGILDETLAVRTRAGIFDISHMGRVQISGAGAEAMLNRLTSNDAAALTDSSAQYSLITNRTGGIIDDIILYRTAKEEFLAVINAGNTRKDLAWITASNSEGCRISETTVDTAMMAIQGPDAPEITARIASNPALTSLERFQFASGSLLGSRATFCRTGYTGEDGFEVIVPAENAADVWRAFLDEGVAACGLGARDALRIEAGYPLYGHEIDDSTSPVEAGLMWVVKLDKGEFVGRQAIVKVKESGPSRKLMGLTLQDRSIPRQGYTILREGEPVGEITSGVFSPTLGHSIAMGYISTQYARPNTEVTVAIRDRQAIARIVAKKALLTS